ncbi:MULTISPECIES: hypothetical protein [Gordonia]|uniref:hypothetical protein n=1 Tax=Gordonia TaxID=2053 RepID=UPI0001DD9314|nr:MULTISPECIES: hypothetical protein [Gordonia]ADK68953.1 hypothetical protein KTR9_4872 [Gordonia sp. KTR9]MCZ4580465.1 hypothetical protein [Gordonia amicalis]
MGFALSTTQSAQFLAEHLATRGGAPTVTSKKVFELVKANLFHDIGAGVQVRIDSDELTAFVARTRFVADPAELGDTVFRVSCLARKLRSDRIVERGTGKVLSTHMGVDYAQPYQLDGIEGVWSVSDVNCRHIVDRTCLLLATCKGYVHPEHVRSVMDWTRIEASKRKYFHTEAASETVKQVVGTGIWVNVPPVRESDFLTKSW